MEKSADRAGGIDGASDRRRIRNTPLSPADFTTGAGRGGVGPRDKVRLGEDRATEFNPGENGFVYLQGLGPGLPAQGGVSSICLWF